MDIIEAPEETLRNVNEGMKQVLNLVADELMFIFFPEEYAQNNPDYWTFDDGSLLGGRSAGSSYYTRETVSTLSTKGWKKVVGNRGPEKQKNKRERREGSVASQTQSSDRRQPASDAEGSDELGAREDDVLNLFASETEDIESPPSAERREDASMTNSAKRDPEEEVLDLRQISSGTSGNAIDLCDAEEVDGVVVTRGQNEELAEHLGESTLQRLQRLRAKREELRQERERYESGIPFNPEPQDYQAEDARPEPQGDYEADHMQSKLDALLAQDLDVNHGQSEVQQIDHHRQQIQAKVQQLSNVLDQIMIKKLNGEFPDDPETRAMEAEIRANLLEFQRWWQPSASDNNIRSAPKPEYRNQW